MSISDCCRKSHHLALSNLDTWEIRCLLVLYPKFVALSVRLHPPQLELRAQSNFEVVVAPVLASARRPLKDEVGCVLKRNEITI